MEDNNKNEQDNDNLKQDKAKVILFTSPTCPSCPPAKEFIGKFSKKRLDFELINYSMADLKGRKKAMQFGVRSVPTFIIQGPAINENIGLIGTQAEWVMNKYLDKALGKNRSEDNEKMDSKQKKKKEFKIGKFKFKF